MSTSPGERTCALARCSTSFPRGARGPFAALCPEHRNKAGLEEYRRELGQPAPERPLRAVIADVVSEVLPEPRRSPEERLERVQALMGLERAVARVHQAEVALRDARVALRKAAERAAGAAPRR